MVIVCFKTQLCDMSELRGDRNENLTSSALGGLHFVRTVGWKGVKM